MESDSGARLAAPYVPFATFETALDKLAALGGAIPPRIDHTVFPSMGGLQKGQVISALKFLHLIDVKGIPDPLLKELAQNKDHRKAIVRQLINERYPNISEGELAGMSPGQLDAKLSDKTYNVSGETRQKARTFLLKAAAFADIPLSKLLTTRGPRGPRKKASKAAVSKGGGDTAGKGVKTQQEQLEERRPLDENMLRMPIALAPDRVAYVELPKDWNEKDAKKLLGLLGLSLDIPIQF